MLKIGKTLNNKPVSLPLSLITERIAIMGRTGSGKTNTATVCVEEMLAEKQQIVIIDPVSVWYGLKSSADGKRQGFPVVILGGHHGDIPLSHEIGAAVADFVVDSGASCVLTIDFEADSHKRKFCKDFARRLYHRKSEPGNQTPLMVVLEEAHLVVPQDKEHGDQEMLAAFTRLMRQGRSRGIGMMLIDQRPASVNKNLLTQVELMIAHQITGTQDRKALEEWVKGQAEADQVRQFVSTLASLGRGEAWFTSPGAFNLFERVHVRARETFDSSKTPKPGEIATAPTARAAVDLEALRGHLASAMKEAAANDPAKLKARIVELDGQLKARPASEPDPHVWISRSEANAMIRMETNALVRRVADQTALISRMTGDLRRIVADSDQATSEMGSISSSKTGREALLPPRTGPTTPQAPARRPEPPTRPITSPKALPDGLRPAHQRILDALAWLAAFGISQPDRSIVAAKAGVSPKSSSFANDVSRLNTSGLICYPSGGTIALTDDGSDMASHPSTTPTLSAIHEAWRSCSIFRPAHVRLIDALIDAYPRSLTREELAQRAGVSPTSSSFANDVSRIVSIGVALYPQKGSVAASRLLFPD